MSLFTQIIQGLFDLFNDLHLQRRGIAQHDRVQLQSMPLLSKALDSNKRS